MNYDMDSMSREELVDLALELIQQLTPDKLALILSKFVQEVT